MDSIQLKNENIYRVAIKTDKGEATGEYLEFDMEDIELPLIYQEILQKLKSSRKNLKTKFMLIDKKQDHKGKKLLSSNEEEKIRVLNDFYKEQAEIYNMFLGKNGVQKLLNGRKMRWTTLDEIDKIIETQIAPKLDLTLDDITKKIKSKYSSDKKDNTLE